jgi:hypothetical protein
MIHETFQLACWNVKFRCVKQGKKASPSLQSDEAEHQATL